MTKVLERLTWWGHSDDSLSRSHCYDSEHMRRALCLKPHPGELLQETPLDSRCTNCERVVREHTRWAESHEEHVRR